MLRAARSGMLADGELFVRSYVAPYRLFIIGAVHIAQALAPMAALAGYEVTGIDPRRAFATNQRFPFISVLRTMGYPWVGVLAVSAFAFAPIPGLLVVAFIDTRIAKTWNAADLSTPATPQTHDTA